MMLSIGMFVFERKSAAYQTLKRSTTQRWAGNERVGEAPAYQYIGPGEDSLDLEGVIYPEIAPGGQVSIEQLRVISEEGEPQTLVSGDGYIHGKWLIDRIEETQTELFEDGAARKIEFRLALRRESTGTTNTRGTNTSTGTASAPRVINRV